MSELWTCPECGRRFANRHQWHSCGDLALDDVLAEHTPEAGAVFDAVADVIAGDGVRIHPQKTRIAFISRMTFASIQLARRWVDLHFITAEPVDDVRIRSLDVHGPTSFDHGVRLPSPGEVDSDVRSWLAAARRRGDQETLDPEATVAPLSGHLLTLARVPLRTTAVASEHGLAVRVPRHVAEIFAAHPRVAARVDGQVLPATIDTARRLLLVDGDGLRSLGHGDGEPLDVFLRSANGGNR